MVVRTSLIALVLLLIVLLSGVASSNDACRTLSWVTIKEINPHPGSITNPINWGHYWIEMIDEKGATESYGWYPSTLGGDILLTGVPGVLERSDYKTYMGSKLDAEYHPVVCDDRTDDEIRTDIRNFANSYGGNWALITRNCHTFVEGLMRSIELFEPVAPDGTILVTDEQIGTPLLPPSTSDKSSGESNEGSNVQSVSPTQDTNSIVGTWKYKDSGAPDDYAWIIIFNAEGTYNIPVQHPSQSDPSFTNPAVTGRWTQNGDTYTGYFFNPYTGEKMPPWTATVHGNSYSGSGFSGSVNAIRLSTPVSGASIAGVGPLIDEGMNGGGGW